MNMDDRKLKLYKYLIRAGKLTIEDIPEPYKSEIQEKWIVGYKYAIYRKNEHAINLNKYKVS